MKDILVIIPVHNYNDEVGELLTRAIKSVPLYCPIKISLSKNVFTLNSKEIGNIIKGGDKIKLHGFGAFYTRKYGERKCYNPVTGTIEKIPASVQPVFKAGPKLREKINNK